MLNVKILGSTTFIDGFGSEFFSCVGLCFSSNSMNEIFTTQSCKTALHMPDCFGRVKSLERNRPIHANCHLPCFSPGQYFLCEFAKI